MFELHTWKRGDRRAPHKPLLLLLAIGAWQSGRALDWHIVKAELSQLLKQFGTLGTPSPQYPFIRLQNDGLWVVDGFADFKGDAFPLLLFKRLSEVYNGVYSLAGAEGRRGLQRH